MLSRYLNTEALLVRIYKEEEVCKSLVTYKWEEKKKEKLCGEFKSSSSMFLESVESQRFEKGETTW